MRAPLIVSHRDAASWRSARRHPGRVTAAAILASVVGHVAILYLAPPWTVQIGRNLPGRSPAAETTPPGLQAVVVAERPAPPLAVRPEAPVAPASTPSTIAELAPPPDSVVAPPIDAAGEPGSRRNPLVWYGYSDSRLALAAVPLKPEEALAEALSQPEAYVSPLRQCYDSLDARAARARRAQDLTVTDRRGRRWGLSADGIHLGPVTVPIRSGEADSVGANWRPARDPCVDR